jgi:peptide/nickel transport system ATP-binding protein
VPELVDLPAGCPFADRCERVIDACRQAVPPAVTVAAAHQARCIRAHDTPEVAIGA